MFPCILCFYLFTLWRLNKPINQSINQLIERQRAMLLEVYKCIHELGPRYRHGMFSQKTRAYDYRDPSILTLPKYNTITHGKKCFMYMKVLSYGIQLVMVLKQ